MSRIYKKKDLYKHQEVKEHNIILIICAVCGEVYEEHPQGVNSNYESISVCPHCQEYNTL